MNQCTKNFSKWCLWQEAFSRRKSICGRSDERGQTVPCVGSCMLSPKNPSLWPSGIGSRLGRNRLWVDSWQCRIYIPTFIEPTITWAPSGFSGYIWLDTQIVLKNMVLGMIRSPPRVWSGNRIAVLSDTLVCTRGIYICISFCISE